MPPSLFVDTQISNYHYPRHETEPPSWSPKTLEVLWRYDINLYFALHCIISQLRILNPTNVVKSVIGSRLALQEFNCHERRHHIGVNERDAWHNLHLSMRPVIFAKIVTVKT